ncbi:hypothetical protein CFP56_033311 [Quercus suber]|uniref:Uncharacterized protein n=1 Tax=Quercus suber TaxID=58331 RepID=A0AAW0MBP1_QUESU
MAKTKATSWQTLKVWVQNLIKTLFRRFRWMFLLAGFTTLAFAAISWKLENSESYWIWHSLWHVSIYTSSFFFLCSKANIVNSENQSLPNGNYELTRQNSRDEEKGNGCSRKLQLQPHRLRPHQTDHFWQWSVAILTKLTAVGVVISKVFEKPTEIPPTALYILPLRLSSWLVFCITLHLTRPHICHRLAFSPNQAQIDRNRSVSLIANNPSLEIHMLSHHQPPPPLKNWQTLKVWVQNLIKTLFRRFRWMFLLAGFTTLAFAAISWKLENSESYWIWHRYNNAYRPLNLKCLAQNVTNRKLDQTIQGSMSRN